MKKSALMTLFTILSFLMISYVSAENAMAQMVTVPQIEIPDIADFSGKYLTVYYAIGNRASIATSADQVNLREVKKKVTIPINGSSITIPSIELEKNGIFMAYNLVVFVVHKDSQFLWKNASGSIPDGEGTTGTTQVLGIDSMTKAEIDEARDLAPNGVLTRNVGSRWHSDLSQPN